MIYSLKNNFVFIHCPRTSGTALSLAIKRLVPDSVYNNIEYKHAKLCQLPKPLTQLRSFTIHRPCLDVRRSYYYHMLNVYNSLNDFSVGTKWFFNHVQEIAKMSIDDYLVSSHEPLNTDDFSIGVDKVFEFEKFEFDNIADFCGIDAKKLRLLVSAEKDIC